MNSCNFYQAWRTMNVDQCQSFENGKCRNKDRQKMVRAANSVKDTGLNPFVCNLKNGQEK